MNNNNLSFLLCPRISWDLLLLNFASFHLSLKLARRSAWGISQMASLMPGSYCWLPAGVPLVIYLFFWQVLPSSYRLDWLRQSLDVIVSEQHSTRAKKKAARPLEAWALEITHHFNYILGTVSHAASCDSWSLHLKSYKESSFFDGRNYKEFMAILNYHRPFSGRNYS